MEIVERQEEIKDKVHYLPHHAVVRLDKKTMKVRVVYDASARSGGPFLNNGLYTGPKFYQKIMNILLQFHSYRVALTIDIKKVFLMNTVTESDQDALQFLWLDDINQEPPRVRVLRFARIVFGVSSSPFLLNATSSIT